MRRDDERVDDIMDCIQKIERYAAQGKETFVNDEMIQVWFLHHFQIIGEAMVKLPRDFRVGYPDIEWNRYISFRNLLVHDYYQLDFDEIWDVIENRIPTLKVQIEEVRKQFPDSPS